MNIKKLKHPTHVCAGFSFQGQLDLARKFPVQVVAAKRYRVDLHGSGKVQGSSARVSWLFPVFPQMGTSKPIDIVLNFSLIFLFLYGVLQCWDCWDSGERRRQSINGPSSVYKEEGLIKPTASQVGLNLVCVFI